MPGLGRFSWRLSVACGLAFCGLTACEGGPTSRSLVESKDSTTLPIELDGPHASIEITINGRTARMLLDTGADQNVLTPEAAARLGLAPTRGQVTGSGAGGAIGPVSWTRIDDVAVGDFHQRHLVAYIVPVAAEFTYDGLLGTPFFNALVTTIDYQNQLLTLRTRTSFAPPQGAEPVPVELVGGKLLVTATAGGVTGRYSVDTGAGNTLTFFTPTVEQYGLRAALAPSLRTITGVGAGGYTHGDLARIPELVIGSNVLRRPVAELSLGQQGVFANPFFAGNLGGELWRRFTVTLDYVGGRMYLQPNDGYEQPFIGPRSGLVPTLDQGRIKVIEVTAISPAAAAGVNVGDVILGVDGVALPLTAPAQTRQSLRRLAQTLQAAPGTAVVLRLSSQNGVERDVTLTLRDLL